MTYGQTGRAIQTYEPLSVILGEMVKGRTASRAIAVTGRVVEFNAPIDSDPGLG